MKPKKTHDWTPRKQSCVLALFEGGKYNVYEISFLTGIPKSTVSEIGTLGTPTSKPKMGRPKLLTARDKRRINMYIKKSSTIQQKDPDSIITELGLSCSYTTLVEAIHELGYHRCVARRRPLLKKIDYKQRLAFAKAHKNWTIEDWKWVIFMDEMSIKVGMNRMTIMWVWRKQGEEFHKDCVNPRKRSTGGMMFWGVFRGGKMGPGLFFELKPGQKINSSVYRDQVLLGPLKTFVEESKTKISEPIVMEDNAPVHKSVCKQPREELKWPPYEHPPNSPDLNSIENI